MAIHGLQSAMGRWTLFILTGYKEPGSDPQQDLENVWTDESPAQFTVLRYAFAILMTMRFDDYTAPEISPFARRVWSLKLLKMVATQADVEAVIRYAISAKAGPHPELPSGALIKIYSACSSASVADMAISVQDAARIVSRAEAGAVSQGIRLA